MSLIFSDQSFGLFLRSFSRHALFSTDQLSHILNIDLEKIRLWSKDQELPEPEEVFVISKKLQLPPLLIWTAYFNSVLTKYGDTKEIRLIPLSEIKTLINSNHKYRKKIKGEFHPSEELSFIKRSPNPQKLGTYMNTTINLSIMNDESVDEKTKKKIEIKYLAKKIGLSENRFRALLKNQPCSVAELGQIIDSEVFHPHFLIRGFFSLIIFKFKLDIYLTQEPLAEEIALLIKNYPN